MKKNTMIDIVSLLLIVTIIGIPIAIYLLRKSDDYGKSDNVIKPTKEVKEKKYEEEKRKFTPLYTETTILPVLTEEDLKKYTKEIVEDKKEIVVKPKKATKKKSGPNKKKQNNNSKKHYTYNKDSKNNKNYKVRQTKKKSK